MYRIGIVAHNSRAEHAHELQESVGAVFLSMDNGHLGCGWNHRLCWTYLKDRNPEPWSVVLEDDAEPIQGFNTQLEAALAAAPTPIVSLYLGTGYPIHWQPRIDLARNNANTVDACWFTSTDLLHAVGVAIRTDLLPSLLETTPTNLPIDEAITHWAKTEGHTVAYTWPSIVQHQDSDTLVKHRDKIPRTQPRKAWWCHTRKEWTGKAVTL